MWIDNRASLEYVLLVLSIIAGTLSIWLLPGNQSIATALGGISAALFLSGIVIKIYTIEEKLNKSITKSDKLHLLIGEHIEFEETDLMNAPLLQQISRSARSDEPLYVQIASQVFGDYAHKQLLEDGKTIIQHLQQRKYNPICIRNIAPAYELMQKIVENLGENYVYIATSKLISYNQVANEHFNQFKSILHDKAKNKKIKVIRLYYLETNPDQRKLQEMRDAKSSNNIIVRYAVLGNNAFSSDSHDLAFLVAPPNNANSLCLVNENSSDPFTELSNTNHRELCAINFSLNHFGNAESVNSIEIVSSESEQYSRYRKEFYHNWMTRSAVLPP
jgi:hypothetical protein